MMLHVSLVANFISISIKKEVELHFSATKMVAPHLTLGTVVQDIVIIPTMVYLRLLVYIL